MKHHINQSQRRLERIDSLKYLLEIEVENWLQTRYPPHQYSREQHHIPGGKTQMINSPKYRKTIPKVPPINVISLQKKYQLCFLISQSKQGR